MSPLLTWEGAGEVPDFCPEGCGGLTEDPYGGPCKACWDAIDQAERANREFGRCAWCHRGGDLDGRFCGEDCAEAYEAEWGEQ